MRAVRTIDPFAPAPLGPKQLRNRFVKAATFEGMAVDNLVTDRLIEFHRVMAAGGVGMTTLARACRCEGLSCARHASSEHSAAGHALGHQRSASRLTAA